MTSRTVARSAAVLGAATALTFAGAGAAMAATTTHEVDGTTLNVTFAKDGLADADVCFAAVVPTAGAAGVVAKAEAALGLDIEAIFDILGGESGITPLKTDDLIPNPIPTVLLGDVTVSADLEPNVYTLISKCTGEDLVLNPAVIVGDTAAAIQGSIGGLSSDGDALGTLSAVMGGEEGGDTGSDIGAMLGGGLDTGSAGE